MPDINDFDSELHEQEYRRVEELLRELYPDEGTGRLVGILRTMADRMEAY